MAPVIFDPFYTTRRRCNAPICILCMFPSMSYITSNRWVPIPTVPHDLHLIRIDVVVIFIGIVFTAATTRVRTPRNCVWSFLDFSIGSLQSSHDYTFLHPSFNQFFSWRPLALNPHNLDEWVLVLVVSLSVRSTNTPFPVHVLGYFSCLERKCTETHHLRWQLQLVLNKLSPLL